MSPYNEADRRLQLLQELWNELKRTRDPSPAYEALVKRIRAESDAYNALTKSRLASGKSDDSNE